MRRWTPRKYLLWAIIVILVTLGAYWLYRNTNLTGPSQFTLATGREDGAYYAYAIEYAEILKEQGVILDILPTAGSIETLQLLIDRKVPAGFVQSGSAEGMATTGLYAIGSLFYEPILVFYRRDAFEEPLEYLYDLRGRRVAIGEAGSGTNQLARTLLADNDLSEANTVLVETTGSETYRLLSEGEVDAGFLVLSPRAALLFDLLLDPDLEMMNFRRAGAYEARYPFLTEFVVTEGTVDLARNIPDEDKTILATTATLVGNELLHVDSARQLLNAAITIHGEGGYFEEEGEFPSAKNTELPVPATVQQFLEVGPSDLEKYLPVSLASTMERLIFVVLPVIVLLYPLLRTAPPFASLVFRYQIYRWYQRLRRVETGLENYTPAELDQHAKELRGLQQELMRRVRVPLFFQADFYNLRLHVKLVIDRVDERRREVAEETHSPALAEAELGVREEPNCGDETNRSDD